LLASGTLLGGAHWGMRGILWGMVLSSMNIYLVNALLASKYIGYSFGRQMKDFIPVLLISASSFAAVSVLTSWAAEIHFIWTAIIFLIVYVALTFVLRLKAIADILDIKTLLIG